MSIFRVTSVTTIAGRIAVGHSIFLLAVSLASCSAKYLVDFNAPSGDMPPMGHGANARIAPLPNGPAIYLHLTNVRVKEISQTHDSTEGRLVSSYYQAGPRSNYARLPNPDYFVIEVFVDPKDKNLKFYPSEVCLENTNKNQVCPVAWIQSAKPNQFVQREIIALREYKRDERGWTSIDRFFGPMCENPFTKSRTELQDNRVVPVSGDAFDFQPLTRDSMVEAREMTCIAMKYEIPPPDPRQPLSILFGALQINQNSILIPKLQLNHATAYHAGWR